MNKKGFTLIELVVVIAIIGLLSTLAVVALGSAREKARDSKRLADIKGIQASLEWYFVGNNSYPVTTEPVTLGDDQHKCLGSNGFNAAGACKSPVYMEVIPSEPQSGQQGYVYNGSSTSYTITANLEGKINDLGPGKITATQNGITN